MARHGGPSIFTWKMAHFCFASVFGCFSGSNKVTKTFWSIMHFWAIFQGYHGLKVDIWYFLTSMTLHLVIPRFFFLQMCMGAFVICNKIAKAFDLLCSWRCFFKVAMAWNWYDYYIKSFSRTCITDAFGYAWF